MLCLELIELLLRPIRTRVELWLGHIGERIVLGLKSSGLIVLWLQRFGTVKVILRCLRVGMLSGIRHVGSDASVLDIHGLKVRQYARLRVRQLP